MRKFLIGVIALLAVSTAWLLSTAPEMATYAPPVMGEMGRDSAMSLRGMKLVEKRENIPQLTLVADTASVAREGGETTLRRFGLRSLGNDGREVTLTAAEGSLDPDTNDVEAWGTVTIRDEMGRTLITDQLAYHHQSRVVATSGEVRIYGADFILRGTGMTGRLDLGLFKLHSRVSATIAGNLDESPVEGS